MYGKDQQKGKTQRKQESENRKRQWKFDGGNKHYMDIGVFRMTVLPDPRGAGWEYRVGVLNGLSVGGGSGCKDLVDAKVQAESALSEYLGDCVRQLEEMEDLICG